MGAHLITSNTMADTYRKPDSLTYNVTWRFSKWFWKNDQIPHYLTGSYIMCISLFQLYWIYMMFTMNGNRHLVLHFLFPQNPAWNFFYFFILDSPWEFKTAFCVFEHLPAQDEFVIPLVGISEFGKCRISEKFDISENMLTCGEKIDADLLMHSSISMSFVSEK